MTAVAPYPLTPPLKWAGGKRWLVPSLRQLWEPHQHQRLVEPFCGGLAVALGLQPQQALLNDINPHTINFYHQLQSGLHIRVKMANDKQTYYRQRERFNHLIQRQRSSTATAAGLFYYLNRTGFNGLCRFNRSGEFNVPFGHHKTINYRRDFQPYQALLKPWEFQCSSFETLALRDDDFIYADPPYDVPFRQYSQHGFHWDEQVTLAHWLAQHPGPVVLSNQATDRIIQLYQSLGFQLLYLHAPRMISRTGDRTPAREVLAYRNLAQQPQKLDILAS